MLEFFSKFFRREKLSEAKLIKRTSRELMDLVAKSAFRVFRDEEFRRQFNFSKIEQVEQDRLFNELEVTALCLLLFVLEEAEEWVRTERIIFWQRVRQRIVKDFLGWLRELKIAPQYISLWKKVIEMRYKEYKEWLPKIYQGAGIADPKFIESTDERRKTTYTRFMTIAIGAIHHLRRGETNPKDPFFKEVRTWLEVLNHQLEEKITKI